MLDSQEEILQELDLTIDQLIYSTSALKQNDIQEILDLTEKKMLERTQESLLSKFVHTKKLLDTLPTQSKRKERLQKLEKKIQILKDLLPSSFDTLSTASPYPPKIGKVRIGRNRKKYNQASYCYS